MRVSIGTFELRSAAADPSLLKGFFFGIILADFPEYVQSLHRPVIYPGDKIASIAS